MQIQNLKALGQQFVNEAHWPELPDFMAYVAWLRGGTVTALKLEAYQGNGDPGDWIGVCLFVARFDESGTAGQSM